MASSFLTTPSKIAPPRPTQWFCFSSRDTQIRTISHVVSATRPDRFVATRSRGTKAKIRNIMSAVCSHAVRYGWMTTNPIRAVRQSAKRERVVVPLAAEEVQKLFAHLGPRERTLVLSSGRAPLLAPSPLRTGLEGFPFIRLEHPKTPPCKTTTRPDSKRLRTPRS